MAKYVRKAPARKTKARKTTTRKKTASKYGPNRPPSVDSPHNPTGAAVGAAYPGMGIPSPAEYGIAQWLRQDGPGGTGGGTAAARPGQSSSRWPGSESGTPWRHERIGRPTPSPYYRDGGNPPPSVPPTSPTGTPDVAPPATPIPEWPKGWTG